MGRYTITISGGKRGAPSQRHRCRQSRSATAHRPVVVGHGHEKCRGKKVTGTFCAKHPKGLSGKRCLSPFFGSARNVGRKAVSVAAQKKPATRVKSRRPPSSRQQLREQLGPPGESLPGSMSSISTRQRATAGQCVHPSARARVGNRFRRASSRFPPLARTPRFRHIGRWPLTAPPTGACGSCDEDPRDNHLDGSAPGCGRHGGRRAGHAG